MTDAVKRAIRDHIRQHGTILTSFGDVAIDGSQLGEGGNGLVYPVVFEGPAVVKLLTEPHSDTPSPKIRRFQREYRRLVRIPQHLNLIRLFHYELVAIGDMRVPAIFMERCGCTLKKQVQQNGTLPPDQLRRLCTELCGVLHHIHEHGIIHRDIKPENILIRDDNSFVLADFGIASFDPEVFPGTELTSNGDRIANFQFSAPEQFQRDANLTAAVDVFALGQVLYWCVTQSTFRGASPPLMASVDERYSQFDELVPLMSQQNPLSRIRTANGVIDQLEGTQKALVTQKWHDHILDSLKRFEEAIRRCTPGQRGIVHLTAKSEIDRLIHALSEISVPNELWWTQGNANNAIGQIVKLDEEHWLLDGTEYKITDCWVSRDDGLDRCSVLVRSDAMQPFGLYEDNGLEDEVAGFFDGTYINYHAHDDGFACINGEIVELCGRSTVRRRYLRPNYIFISTRFNSVLVSAADQVIQPLIEKYNSGQSVGVDELKKLQKLPKHEVSRLYD